MPQTVPVLLIGDKRLRKVSIPVDIAHDDHFKEESQLLTKALEEFRTSNGFGRAISAPQIGVNKRFIACNLGKGTFIITNPVITYKSDEMFTLWDDCMSFPWLMVKVQRHRCISIQYENEEGTTVEWNNLDMATSELLQHEIDHLDGLLALDRATDKSSIIARELYTANKQEFDSQVDYSIVSTISS